MDNQYKENKIEIPEENPKNKNEDIFCKNLESSQLIIMNEFKKIKNTYSDDIIPKIKHHKRALNNQVKILVGDENEQINTLFNKFQKKELHSSKSTVDITYISDKAKKLRKKINFQVNKVKKSHEDLTAINGLYLDNNIFPENKSIIKSQEKDNYEEGIRKKNLRNYFELISNNYHNKLNLAFLKYNPLIHSNNLKKLLQVSSELRDDVSKTKQEIDGDISAMQDKHKYSKLYQKIKTTKHYRNKSIELLTPNSNKNKDIKLLSPKTTKISEQGILNNLNKLENKTILPRLSEFKNFKLKRESKINMGVIKNIKRKESKKFLDVVDQQFDDMNRLHSISKEIEKYIDDENISKKIDDNVKDFKEFKYLESFKDNNDDKTKSIFKPKDYYYLQKRKINGMFGDLYIKNLKARAQEDERNLVNKLRINRNDYFKNIHSDMKLSLNEFDKNMDDNELKLEKKIIPELKLFG